MSPCDYSDSYIPVKRTITILKAGTAVTPNNGNKKGIFKNCAQFTDCINKINNTQVDNAIDIDVVRPMNNLTENSNLWCLWQYCRDEPDFGQ